ncbi:MAG: hypothetical protein XD95_0234 [Microgenomates bacterium 39_7]|nr:MAG: hypothetical protein XD95_0234 [Microgenomates bacterium 39_7]
MLISDIDVNIGQKAVDEGLPYAQDVRASTGGQVVANIISGFLRIAIIIGAVILLFNLIYAGIEWISAGGDSGKIEKARNRLTQSVVGILVLATSIALFIAVNQLLGNPINIGLRGGGGSGDSSIGNPACVCGNGKLALTGSVGKLYLANDAPCFRCTDSGWQPVGGTCSVITCY